jgi:hypothetical protein
MFLWTGKNKRPRHNEEVQEGPVVTTTTSDETPPKKQKSTVICAESVRKTGSFIDDTVIDLYLEYLRRSGGEARRQSCLLVPTWLASLLWYGDSPEEVLVAFKGAGFRSPLQYANGVYFVLNTDAPQAMARTGGTHWFLVVAFRTRLYVWDSCGSRSRKLPSNAHTSKMLSTLLNVDTENSVSWMRCGQQRESECALCTLQNTEVLYRLQHWDDNRAKLDVTVHYSNDERSLRDLFLSWHEAQDDEKGWWFSRIPE